MMTQQPELSPVQESGIGGPVDLAEIERFRVVRMAVTLGLLAVTVCTVAANMAGLLDWPDDFRGGDAIPFSLMAINVFVWAALALSVRAGNRVELALVLLTVPIATGAGIMGTFSITSSLLAFEEVKAPFGWLLIVPFLDGYMLALTPIMLGLVQGSRRYRRLLRADASSRKPQQLLGTGRPT